MSGFQTPPALDIIASSSFVKRLLNYTFPQHSNSNRALNMEDAPADIVGFIEVIGTTF
jgi:hypothetical protein